MPLTLNTLTMDEVQAAIDALQTDVSALQVDVLLLEKNVRDYTAVDMSNADYTMSALEANVNIIILANGGDGTKTLTWPTSADTSHPLQQLVITAYIANPVTIASETGGSTAQLYPGSIYFVSVLGGVSALNINAYTQGLARSGYNGVSAMGAGSNSFTDALGGKLLIGSDAAAQTVDIAAGNYTSNLTARVYCTGAGGVTVQGALGVTVTGNTTLTSGQSCTIYRDSTAETYYCV